MRLGESKMGGRATTSHLGMVDMGMAYGYGYGVESSTEGWWGFQFTESEGLSSLDGKAQESRVSQTGSKPRN